MSIDWIWTIKDSAGVDSVIGDQLVDINSTFLQMRNPWIADSVFMGKLYSSGFFFGILAIAYYLLMVAYGRAKLDYGLLISVSSMMIFILLMLALRVRIIKSQSDFVFNRLSRSVCYRERGKIISGDWGSAIGGLQSKSEFTGKGISVSHSLIVRMQAESAKAGSTTSKPVSLFVVIDSNEPSAPQVLYVGQIWEFIRLFMDVGPQTLPDPVGFNWWYVPLYRECLTLSEAWRHYAPWRTGEPGEMQGKKNWLVLFPYNLFCALCWYVVCRVFNVRSAPPPTEAMG